MVCLTAFCYTYTGRGPENGGRQFYGKPVDILYMGLDRHDHMARIDL
jgi:hypothetical protein